jgi:hypothetical protein
MGSNISRTGNPDNGVMMKGTPGLPLSNDGIRSPSAKKMFKAAASTVPQNPAISVPANLSVVVVTIGINSNTTKITIVRIVQTAAATPLLPLTWHSVNQAETWRGKRKEEPHVRLALGRIKHPRTNDRRPVPNHNLRAVSAIASISASAANKNRTPSRTGDSERVRTLNMRENFDEVDRHEVAEIPSVFSPPVGPPASRTTRFDTPYRLVVML